MSGRIVLFDFEICKVGKVGNRTFTLCGVPDYLSPEQISQQGHNEAVDFWSLGVLLYELACHENPFSANDSNEVTIFSKITALGPNSLPVNEDLPAPLMSLIQGLVVPNPVDRLGMGDKGMAALKAHRFFESIRFESNFLSLSSPLRNFAINAKEEHIQQKEDQSAVIAKWEEVVPDSKWADDLLSD